MFKRIALPLLMLTLALVCGACGSDSKEDQAPAKESAAPAGAEKKIVLRGATIQDPANPSGKTLYRFAELLNERTNGRITMQVFHSAQLGNERDELEGLRMGSLDMCTVAAAPMSGFMEKIALLDLPFLWKDVNHVDTVLEGEIGLKLLKEMEQYGFIGLGFTENGFRHITNNKRPIFTPGDMKDIKLRVMESPISVATWNAVGCNATPMAWGEVFTALQQKTVDGQENPIVILDTNRIYEVQKYLSLSRHSYTPCPFVFSKLRFDKLSPEDQQLILDLGREMATYHKTLNREMEAASLKVLLDGGMEVNEIDRDSFMKAMAPVYDQFVKDDNKAMIETILNYKY